MMERYKYELGTRVVYQDMSNDPPCGIAHGKPVVATVIGRFYGSAPSAQYDLRVEGRRSLIRAYESEIRCA